MIGSKKPEKDPGIDRLPKEQPAIKQIVSQAAPAQGPMGQQVIQILIFGLGEDGKMYQWDGGGPNRWLMA